MPQQRGRPCKVPTDYRSFDHTAAACHRQLRSTGTTVSPKRCWSKACLEFGLKFHWIRQQSRGTVMKGERAFCYVSLCGPGLTLCSGLLWGQAVVVVVVLHTRVKTHVSEVQSCAFSGLTVWSYCEEPSVQPACQTELCLITFQVYPPR